MILNIWSKITHNCLLCGQLADASLLCPYCQLRWQQQYLARPSQLFVGRHWHQLAPFPSQLGYCIKQVKYRRALHFLRPIHWLLEQWLSEQELKSCTLIPMPLHPWRQWRRGFNQCHLLAEPLLARGWQLESKAIVRRKHTKALEGLSRQERQQQMSNAFSARHSLAGRSVLLLDDIVTSGASMQGLLSCCQGAGAGQIQILSLCVTKGQITGSAHDIGLA